MYILYIQVHVHVRTLYVLQQYCGCVHTCICDGCKTCSLLRRSPTTQHCMHSRKGDSLHACIIYTYTYMDTCTCVCLCRYPYISLLYVYITYTVHGATKEVCIVFEHTSVVNYSKSVIFTFFHAQIQVYKSTLLSNADRKHTLVQ